MPIRIAPRIWRTTRMAVSARPMTNTRTGQAEFTVDAQSQWNGGTGLIWDTTHKAGVDQADERDEKANADDDAGLDRIRYSETQRFGSR